MISSAVGDGGLWGKGGFGAAAIDCEPAGVRTRACNAAALRSLGVPAVVPTISDGLSSRDCCFTEFGVLDNDAHPNLLNDA